MKTLRSDLPRLKQVFICTLVFSLAAHAYMYFALAPSHDAVSTLFNSIGDSTHQLSLGRFMQPLYWRLRGRLPVPWLVGMLSVVFLAVGSWAILCLFGIQNRAASVLLCGVFATNLTVTATNATYQYSVDMYALAMALASVGMWLLERCKKWGPALAALCFVCSMGFYQAYIDVAIGLALLLLIQAVMEGETFPALWRRGLRYAVSLLCGGILYFVCVKLSTPLTHTELSATSYNGLHRLFENDLPGLLKLIPGAYFSFAAFFFSPLRAHNTAPVCVCLLLMILLGLAMWLRRIRQRHIRGRELAVLLLCAALLPLGLNFIYVLSNGLLHQLMTYSYFLIYIPLLLPVEWAGGRSEATANTPPGALGRWPRLCRGAAVCLCAYMIFHNVVFANGAYYYKRIMYDASYAHAFSIAEQIEQDPDYVPGETPVAILGEFSDSYAARSINDYFAQYQHVTGLWDNTTSFTYDGTLRAFFTGLLGHPINAYFSQEQLDAIRALPAVQDMPVFPKEGYCAMVDGVMVVKLTE